MSRSTHHSADVRNYNLAQAHFKNIKPVKSSAWPANTRPLHPKRGAYPQYKLIQREGGEYYDIVLYETIMGRHYAQAEDGSYTSYYNNYNTALSRDFLYDTLGRNWANEITDTNGKQVVVHIGFSNTKHYCVDPTDGQKFSTRIVLVQPQSDQDRWRIDTARSHEAKFYSKVSTDADKQARAQLRQRLETLVEMAALRLPQMARDADPQRWKGEPFSSWPSNAKRKFLDMRGLCDLRVVLEDAWTDEARTSFFDAAQHVYDTLLSKRAYAEVRGAWDSTFADACNKMIDGITEKDFTQSFMRFLIDRSGNNTQRGRKYLPQFSAPGEWPRTGVFAE